MLKKIPSIEPKNVPIEPIDVPINKNILIIDFLDDPIVLSKAISPDLALTSIIIEDIILKAATKIIKVKIKNMTFFSTFKALINVVDFFYDKEEKDYNEKKATYGDMVNQPRDHIFLEFKRLKNYIKNYE